MCAYAVYDSFCSNLLQRRKQRLLQGENVLPSLVSIAANQVFCSAFLAPRMFKDMDVIKTVTITTYPSAYYYYNYYYYYKYYYYYYYYYYYFYYYY